MKDVIEILRQQIVLCTRLMELIKEQRPEIIGGRAKEASALASAMEPLMTKLMALEKKQKQLQKRKKLRKQRRRMRQRKLPARMKRSS